MEGKQFNRPVFVRYHSIRWKGAPRFLRSWRRSVRPRKQLRRNSRTHDAIEFGSLLRRDSTVIDHFSSVTGHCSRLESFHGSSSQTFSGSYPIAGTVQYSYPVGRTLQRELRWWRRILCTSTIVTLPGRERHDLRLHQGPHTHSQSAGILFER